MRLFHNPSRYAFMADNEIRTGAALRIVSCSTFGERVYYLDIRCLHSSRNAVELLAYDEQGNPAKIGFRSRTKILSPVARRYSLAWYESQYIVEVPSGFGTLYIDCKRATTSRILASIALDEGFWNHDLKMQFFERARNPFADGLYEKWLEEHRADAASLAIQRTTVFDNMPLMSLVCPVFHTEAKYLRCMLESVRAQTYANWELVIVNASPDDEEVREVLDLFDDERIRIVELAQNEGIAANTNHGIDLSNGDYVGFIDHDDFIEPDLLFEYVKAINEEDGTDLLYCDEDSFSETDGYKLALFKPDANLDLLYSNNYVLHLLMVSRSIIERSVRSQSELDGAQDYDLTLQAFLLGRKIVHVPRVLYHWRIYEQSTNSGNTEAKPYAAFAGKRALEKNFERRNLKTSVQFTDVPFVYRCDFITQKNASDIEVVQDGRTPTAYARNKMARRSRAPFLLFTSRGCMPLDEKWEQTMLGYFEREELGILGAKLVNPDGLISQAGLVIRCDGDVTIMGRDLPSDDAGYNGRFNRPCNMNAVPADCCMVRRSEFLELGAYDIRFNTMLYANIDLCLRYLSAGKLVTWTPFVHFIHASQPVNLLGWPVRQADRQIERDKQLLRERWPAMTESPDKFFNPNLDEMNPYYVLRH